MRLMRALEKGSPNIAWATMVSGKYVDGRMPCVEGAQYLAKLS